MRICLLSDEHYPHTGADTIVVMNTASALGAQGADVELVVPRLWHGHMSEGEVCEHYGVHGTFKLRRLPSWPPPWRTLRMEKLLHGSLGPMYAYLRGFDLVHTRDLLPIMVAQTARRPWSFETYRRHAEEKPFLPRFTRHLGLKRSVGAVAHSKPAADSLVKLGFDEDAVIVARPGISPELFAPALDKVAAREKLGLDPSLPQVVYVGNVGQSKGTDEIADVAARLPGVDFLVVGGAKDAVDKLKAELHRKGLSNVTAVGHQPPANVAPYLYAADVLFQPAIHKNVFAGSLLGALPISTLPGTPLKLYGYLASGRPIVSADQPHTRDLLEDGRNALLVPPGDGKAAADAIQRLLDDRKLSDALKAASLGDSKNHTWENRAKIMLQLFERRLAER